jgi:hypothetical protein
MHAVQTQLLLTQWIGVIDTSLSNGRQSACMTWHCVQGFRFDNLDIPSPKAASPLLACQGPDKLCGATDWTVASGMYVISIDFPGYVCIAPGTEVLWVTTPSAVSGCYVKYPEGTSP